MSIPLPTGTTGNFIEIEVSGSKDNILLKPISDAKDDHKHGFSTEWDLELPQNTH